MRRSRSNTWDWSSYLPRWPRVVPARMPTYVSVFAPRGDEPLGGLEPTHLPAILIGCEEPALYHARQRTHVAPDAPKLSGPFPTAPKPPGERPVSSVEPKWEDYAPKEPPKGLIGTLRDILNGSYGAAERVARQRFEAEHTHWKQNRWQLQRAEQTFERAEREFQRNVKQYATDRERIECELEEAETEYAAYVRRFEAERAEDLKAFDSLISKAANGETEAIEQLAVQACLAVPIPLALPATPAAHFDGTEGILLLSVSAPNLEEVGLHVQLKTKERAATDKEVKAAQEFVVHALSLRILHEIFATAEFARVRMVGVNLTLAYTDRRTGKRKNEIVASLVATREEFSALDIAHVDPKLCFRSLKGVATPSFHEPAPVRPFLSFGSADGRIIAEREVVDHLEQETNLATLDWEDFEHIVRELFAKLFSTRAGAEVHVTRASRDYGVDALIFDPDPIHGGKFVIQAKRYVNTVDVAAVRDLYGTVQNEGANRGYLVTTSSFGPEAHAFAKGKPLTLIDGAHLLCLLKEQGYTFRIDLQEARQILHGR